MNTKIDMLAELRKAVRTLREQDPLLKRGIESNYVCVIRSEVEHHLIDAVQASPFYVKQLPIHLQLHLATGRRTWVFPDAPQAVEYLSPEDFQSRYGSRITERDLESEDPEETEDQKD